jgi:hypothetical protein
MRQPALFVTRAVALPGLGPGSNFEREAILKFGLFYQMQLPKPRDADVWYPGQEAKLIKKCLNRSAFADKVGFDHVMIVKHQFNGKYNHLPACDVIPGAIPWRASNIRMGHGTGQMMPANEHRMKVAENLASANPAGRVL